VHTCFPSVALRILQLQPNLVLQFEQVICLVFGY
jgi:hypothetical protein